MNKYEKALETIKNEYDAFYILNKYGDCTHAAEFTVLADLEQAARDNALNAEAIPQAIGWIRYAYDCYYKDELQEGSAFDYLESIARRLPDDAE